MLPKFPKFKKLELTDQRDIEAITSQYPPYSHFDFSNLWSWDIRGDTQLSELHGNLVVVMSDHFSSKFFYSFIGDVAVNDTIEKLIDSSVEKKMSQLALRMVPEISLLRIDFNKFFIEIDLNSCDYIYDLTHLSKYEGIKYSNKRKIFNSFSRNYNHLEVKILGLSDPKYQKLVLSLSHLWAQNKFKKNGQQNLLDELKATQRFIEARFKNSLCVGLFSTGTLIGYSIFTLAPNQYSICHFSKADVSYVGVYEYLMREGAAVLLNNGCRYLNYEEDLGLPGLRFAKASFRPTGFLRKYFVKSHKIEKSLL